MKKIAIVVVLSMFSYGGYKFAGKKLVEPPAEQVPTHEHENKFSITSAEFDEYEKLKGRKKQYEKANEILGKMLVIFLADLGLRLKNSDADIIGFSQKSQSQRAVKENNVQNVEASAAASETQIDRRKKIEKKSPNQFAQKREREPVPAKARENGFLKKVTREQARGAVVALYQAVLWRNPDKAGGASAARRFSNGRWVTYIRNAREMAMSQEFESKIWTNYTRKQIINRMYAVFMGRCASGIEMKVHLKLMDGGRGRRVIADILKDARELHFTQIFKGGYKPESCGVG